MKDNIPKLYITRDKSGVNLWYSLLPPTRTKGNAPYSNIYAVAKIGLPESEYGELLKMFDCISIDIFDIICQTKFS